MSSIEVDIRAYVLTTAYGEFLAVQEELVLDIVRIVRKAGTGFAFPSQTAYLARDTGLDEAARAHRSAHARPDPASRCRARGGGRGGTRSRADLSPGTVAPRPLTTPA
jgi:hypothetical protein